MMRTTVLLAVATTATAAGCHHADQHGSHAGPVLSEVAIAIPIRGGRTAAWQQAIVELTGPRYREYQASRQRMGVTSQTTFLQQTPMGDFALIHLTGADVRETFHRMSASQDPWDVKWRQMTQDLHGMDFAKGEKVVPEVEPAFSMQNADLSGSRPYMWMAPVTDVAAFRALAAELSGPKHADYVRSRERLGVRREVVFLETTSMGSAMVVYWLAPDPQASLQGLLAAEQPFDRWLLAAARGLHGLPLAALPVSGNVLVGQFPHPQ